MWTWGFPGVAEFRFVSRAHFRAEGKVQASEQRQKGTLLIPGSFGGEPAVAIAGPPTPGNCSPCTGNVAGPSLRAGKRWQRGRSEEWPRC